MITRSNFSLTRSRHARFNDLEGGSSLFKLGKNFWNASGGITLIAGPGQSGSFNINATPPYFPALSIILTLSFSGPTPPVISDDSGNIYDLFDSNSASNATIQHYIARQPINKITPTTKITLTNTSGQFCFGSSQAFGYKNISIVDSKFLNTPIVLGSNDVFSDTVTSTKKNTLYLGTIANFDIGINVSNATFTNCGNAGNSFGVGFLNMFAYGLIFSANSLKFEVGLDIANVGGLSTVLTSAIACG